MNNKTGKFALLTRDQFREGVFARDGHRCVVCKHPAKDAHHIIERRLWTDGGYYLENGASLCEAHHIQAEQTTLTCEKIRELCGIDRFPIPEHMYDDVDYDKWGNVLLPNGTRLKGELYFDESVQKILASGNVLNEFTKYVKYPRTYHLPWSNLLKDDRMMPDDSCFVGNEVVVTLKMDGENTTMYKDYIHARSINSGSHPSRDWVKGLWSRVSYMLDDDMRVCGENLYALHTIHYQDLTSYFNVFSIWSENVCMSWDDTVEYAGILGLDVVPVIYRGPYDAELIKTVFAAAGKGHEGYVVRNADSFAYQDFRRNVGKYVKPEFRQAVNNSHGHWISKKMETNKLKV
jgi:RNA ligase